jgi:hypothetical protein
MGSGISLSRRTLPRLALSSILGYTHPIQGLDQEQANRVAPAEHHLRAASDPGRPHGPHDHVLHSKSH